jgi:hypothetical protein
MKLIWVPLWERLQFYGSIDSFANRTNTQSLSLPRREVALQIQKIEKELVVQTRE